MSDPQTGLSPGTVFGGYRIDSLVARGGMGVIYRATQLALDRAVALKVVAPELVNDETFRERFKREALLAAAIDHPNILPVYEAGEVDGQLFLAMRYLVGTDLDSLIRRERVLTPERAAALLVQVGSALDAAHHRGLVHRDVKPANILIAEEYGEERAYLTDFGLTKSTASDDHLTRTGYMVGTLDFVAPEQVQGGQVDGRADTYSLACVMYEAVTGSVPFDRPSDAAKLWAHLSDPPPSAAEASPTVSAELDAVIRRGMAKQPEQRYPSSGEFARAARAAAAAPVASSQLGRTEIGVTQVDPIDGLTQIDPGAVPSSPTPVAQPVAAARTEDRVPRRLALPGSRRARLVAGGVLGIGVIAAIVAVAAGGGGKSPPAVPASSRNSVGPPATTTASTPTTTNAAASQAGTYYAQVYKIFPGIRHALNNLPSGRTFGKASFSRDSLTIAAELRGAADNLDVLSPPQQVLVAHEAIVAGLIQLQQEFRTLALDSDNRNFSGAHTALQSIKAGLRVVDAKVVAVERAASLAGFRTGSSGTTAP